MLPALRAPSAYSVPALQVTRRHSHSDATTLAAITADRSRHLIRYDSDPSPARAYPGRDCNPVPDSCRQPGPPSLSFPPEGVGRWESGHCQARHCGDPPGRGEMGNRANPGEIQRGSHSCHAWREEGLWSSPHAEWAG